MLGEDSNESVKTVQNLIAFVNNRFAQIQKDLKTKGQQIKRLERLKRKEREDEEIFNVKKHCSEVDIFITEDREESAARALLDIRRVI